DLSRVATAALSVVLPIHNIETSLAPLVGDWVAYLGRLKRAYELILVNDGSTDGTAATADGLATENAHIRVLHHAQRRGFGAGLRTGIAVARHPLLFYAGTDQPYRPADLGKLLGRMNKVHLVSGYRAGRPVPLLFHITGFVWRWLLYLLFGIV